MMAIEARHKIPNDLSENSAADIKDLKAKKLTIFWDVAIARIALWGIMNKFQVNVNAKINDNQELKKYAQLKWMTQFQSENVKET